MPSTYYTRSWAGAETPRSGAHPRFYLEAVQDELASAREGRPIYFQEERVEIFLPGNPYTQPVHRVTDKDRQEWPNEYKAFLEGTEVTPEGTPLEEWPVLNRAHVMELRGLNLRSVEDVRSLPDNMTQQKPGLMGLRNLARAYLDDAAAQKLSTALMRENDELKAEISRLSHQVEELGAMTNRLHAETMTMRNAPSPIATAIPGLYDPVELARQQQHGMEPRESPESSLSAFSEERRPRSGRPPRQSEAA